jgi:hypothetical protein
MLVGTPAFPFLFTPKICLVTFLSPMNYLQLSEIIGTEFVFFFWINILVSI